jgi:hypothetical protein
MFRNVKGLGVVITNAPTGTYTNQYADVPYYQTPPPQTFTLLAGSNITVTGNYTFPDANSNGISDWWETNFFGIVSTNRTKLTDSDGDKVPDYQEFIAGTDPTSTNSVFKINTVTKLANGNYRLSWPSFRGRGYRVYGSTNALNWAPLSDWIRALSAQTTYTLPPPVKGAPYVFRVQVAP